MLHRDAPGKHIRVCYQLFILWIALMLIIPGLFFAIPVKSDGPASPAVVCKISFEEPALTDITLDNRTFIQILMKDCFSYASTGDPALPSYPARILVPKGTNVVDISVSYGSAIRIACDVVNKPVVPQQEYIPLSKNASDYPFEMNETMYNLSEVTFDKIYEDGGTGFCRGFKILTVYLYPVQYLPKQGLLYYLPSITITVDLQYDDCAILEEGDSLFRGSDDDVDFISSIVVNPDAVDSYFTLDGSGGMPLGGGGDGGGYTPLSGGYTGGLCDTSHHYDYVIITSNSLKSTTGYSYNWTSLINHRQTYSGLAGTIVTVEDIDACTDYWNATSTFNDSQAHIREFCKDAYQDWGTEYILLGGDWDSTASHQIVPYRLFTDIYETDTYDTMACDMYYSHLDGNWYYSSSAVWGGGEGCANDLYGELFVGRICAYNASMVSNAISKIIWYDLNAPDDWLKKVSFWGGNLGWTSTSKQYMEEIRLGTDTYRTFTGFEEWNTAHPDYQIDTSERLYHADLGSNYKTYQSNSVEDDNASMINHLDHSSYDTPFGLPNWLFRYNTKPFFGYSQGCLAGRFHAGYAGCEQMICRHADRHAYALVLNTGYGYGSSGSTNGPSQYINCYFWDFFFNNQSNNMNNWQLGKAFSYAQDKMGAIVDSQSHAWCYAWYSAHFFGDPAQTLRISSTNRSVVLSAESPSDGATGVSVGTSSLSVAINDPEGDSFNWTIQTSPNVGSSSANGASNGSKSCSITGLSYSTTYHWYVNATDSGSGDWTRESYSFTTESAPANNPPTFSGISTTNGSTGVSLVLSSLSITIREPEGHSFNWTIQTSPNVGSSSANGASNGSKSCTISGLGYGTIYKWYVNATDGNSWTRAWYSFTTRSQYTPSPPSSFSGTAFNRTKINLAWTHGSYSNKVYIRYATGGYPADKNSGTYLCNSTGTSYSVTGLTSGTTYYFRAWAWNTTDSVWSSSYSSTTATTASNHAPTFGSPSPTNDSTAQDLSLTWGISITDSDGDSFSWSIACSNGQSNSGSSASNGTKQLSISGLSYSTQYKIWVNATDSYSGTTRAWFIFTTKTLNEPSVPSSFSAAAYGRYQIDLMWVKGSKADRTYIEYKTTSSPWNRGEGTLLYNSTGTSTLQSGLAQDTTRYYQAWSWNATSNFWSSSYSSASATTSSNHVPSFGSPTPTNQSTASISLSSLSILIEDSDGDNFDWNIETSPGVGSGSSTGASNGTKTCTISGLQYSTTYKWYVNVTDDIGWTNVSYTFTTESQPQSAPSTPPSSPPPTNTQPVADAGGPYTGYVGQSISFNGTGSHDDDDDTLTYAWDFGDGATGTGVTPSHTYSSVSNYVVKLTVSDEALTDSDSTTAIIANYSAEDTDEESLDNSPDDQNNTQNENFIPIMEIEEQLGCGPLNASDIQNVSINNGTSYLVDINGDGIYDVFCDGANSKSNVVLTEDGTYLIDVDGDDKWDYVYSPASNLMSPYEAVKKESVGYSAMPMLTVFAVVAAVLVCLIVVFRENVKVFVSGHHLSALASGRTHLPLHRNKLHFFSSDSKKISPCNKPRVKKMGEYYKEIQDCYEMTADFVDSIDEAEFDEIQTGSRIDGLVRKAFEPEHGLLNEMDIDRKVDEIISSYIRTKIDGL